MSRLVPAAWMTECAMSRIVTHWTAGGPEPSELDKSHYHLLISQGGRVIRGFYDISDNVKTSDNRYAAHTRGLNTGSIGVAMCGMAQAVQKPFLAGPHPLTRGQWNNTLLVLADLCERYSIKPSKRTLLMHSEVPEFLGVPQAGKWDVDVLPFDRGEWANVTPGDEMRARVARLLGA